MVDQLIIFLYEMRNEAIGLMTWFVKEWSLKRSRFVEVTHGGEMIRKVLVLTYFAQKITSVLSFRSLWFFSPFFMWRNLHISLHHPFYQYHLVLNKMVICWNMFPFFYIQGAFYYKTIPCLKLFTHVEIQDIYFPKYK